MAKRRTKNSTLGFHLWTKVFSLRARPAAKVNTTAHYGSSWGDDSGLMSPLALKDALCHYEHTHLAAKKNRNWSALDVIDRSVQSDLDISGV